MLPALTNCDPGDENDYRGNVCAPGGVCECGGSAECPRCEPVHTEGVQAPLDTDLEMERYLWLFDSY